MKKIYQCRNEGCQRTFSLPARITSKVSDAAWASSGSQIEKYCCPFCHSLDFVEILKVNKLSTESYPVMFDTHIPIRWFWLPDGSFDGIECHVEHLTKRDQDLIKELNFKLAQSLGISHTYDVTRGEDKP